MGTKSAQNISYHAISRISFVKPYVVFHHDNKKDRLYGLFCYHYCVIERSNNIFLYINYLYVKIVPLFNNNNGYKKLRRKGMVRRDELDWVVVNLNNINMDAMSESEKRQIGYNWHEMLKKFYSNPENEIKFQEWLKEKYKTISHE